jgi:hypothetical protein
MSIDESLIASQLEQTLDHGLANAGVVDPPRFGRVSLAGQFSVHCCEAFVWFINMLISGQST